MEKHLEIQKALARLNGQLANVKRLKNRISGVPNQDESVEIEKATEPTLEQTLNGTPNAIFDYCRELDEVIDDIEISLFEGTLEEEKR